MCWAQIAQYGIPAAVSLFGSYSSTSAQKEGADKAARAAQETAMAQLGFAKESRDIGLQLSDPSRQAGYAATAAMMDMMGLPRTAPDAPAGYAGVGASQTPGNLPELRMKGGSTAKADAFLPQGTPGTKGSLLTGILGLDSKPRPRWRRYAQDLENYAAGAGVDISSLNEPRKHAKRKRWREYATGLQDLITEGGGGTYNLPPGVTAPNLAGYEQYEWQADPGYEFRLSEGMRAAEAGSGARGNRLSGGALKDLLGYGQSMGAQEYTNIYNRLATLAGYGQSGIAQGVGAVGQYGMQGSNIMGDLGYNRMSAYTAGANARSGWYGDIADVLYNLPWNDWFGGNQPTSSSSERPAVPGFER